MAKTTKTQANEMAQQTRVVAQLLQTLSLETGVLITIAAQGGTTRAELDALEGLVALRERICSGITLATRAAAELDMVGGEVRVEA